MPDQPADNPYCDIAPGHPLHGPYHDRQYGFPVTDDAALLERLALEINQAGLSWQTILQKKDGFHAAFQAFDPGTVAAYGQTDFDRLMADPRIIRNRLKINAVIKNAGRLLEIRDSHGGFDAWLKAHHPLTKDQWVKLFKANFAFTGGEIVGEFLISIGYLPGAHRRSCPVYAQIAKLNPPWMA